MNRWFVRFALLVLGTFAFTFNSPAPLIYRAGEGWTYESVGGAKWQRTRAKDQLEVAQAAFDKKNYSLSLKAARRTVKKWPLSDYAPQAQYLVGRSFEGKRKDQQAFLEYQVLLEKYPKVSNYNEVLERQYAIANRFFNGQWIRLWGIVPFFPSKDKTVEMYGKLIKNGPYSEVAPQAQMKIGAVREKQADYPEAVKAYERAADRYHDRNPVAADALFKSGLAYDKQAKRAEYDQSIAGQAIATFTDFIAMYPEDPRTAGAQKHINALKAEQARGSFQTAAYYEKKKRWAGALVYYNEVLIKDPTSKYSEQARQRIDEIKKRTAGQTAQN